MPKQPDFQAIFTESWETYFTQCYPNGKVKHTELCQFMQLTAGHHAEAGGLGFTEMQEKHQAWVLLSMQLEFIELPRWKDAIEIKTWIVSMDGMHSERAIEVYANGKKCAAALTHWVVMNTQTRRAVDLEFPHEHFTNYPENLGVSQRFDRPKKQKNYSFSIEKYIKLSDVDLVRHANNVKYLEWCLDEMHAEEVIHNGIHSIQLLFMRELKWNDKLQILMHQEGKSHHFAFEKEGKTHFLMDIHRR